MKKLSVLFVVLLMVGALVMPNAASATLEEAQAMVEQAVAYYQANGKEKTLSALNDPNGEFVKGDLYVFAYDADATVIAHPINAKLVGVSTLEVPDVDGKFWRKEAMAKIAQDGTATVDYKYKNPKSGKVGQKTTYFKKVGDIILGCGTYK